MSKDLIPEATFMCILVTMSYDAQTPTNFLDLLTIYMANIQHTSGAKRGELSTITKEYQEL